MNLFSFIFPTAEAATPCYKLLAPVGTLTSGGCYTLTQYLNGIFVTIIGIAGILAVVMIVICGIRLMTAASAGGKSEAKKCITNAIFGVLIAIGSWLLLNTLNPQLLKNDAQITVMASSTAPGSTYGPSTSGTFSWEVGPSCPKVVGQIASIVDPAQCGPGGPGVCCRYLPVAITPPVASPPPAAPPSFIPPLPPPATTGDAVFSTSRAAAYIIEGTGAITIKVRHVAGLAGSIDYSTAGLTASAPSDFTPVTGTLFFPAGSTELSITIPITDDSIVEPQENFQVVLSNPTGGVTLNVNNPLIVTIEDNDVTPKDITPPVVTFISPVSGIITTIATTSTNFTVSEDTNLYGVDVRVYRASTSVQVFATKVCANNTTVCPKLGGTFTPVVSSGLYNNEFFNIVAIACDLAKNCGRATTTIGFTKSCFGATSTNCFILPSGVGATTSLTTVKSYMASTSSTTVGVITRMATNAHLIKLTSPTGGGSVSVTTAPITPPLTPAWCGSSPAVYCTSGCDQLFPDTCFIPKPPAVCGPPANTTCPFGCEIDPGVGTICGMPLSPCSPLTCAVACDTSFTPPQCFVPQPVVVATISSFPGDISIKAPCGNGGSVPGSTNMVINFGTTSSATKCGLTPGFNYYLSVFPTDGKLHNFVINYNWTP